MYLHISNIAYHKNLLLNGIICWGCVSTLVDYVVVIRGAVTATTVGNCMPWADPMVADNID